MDVTGSQNDDGGFLQTLIGKLVKNLTGTNKRDGQCLRVVLFKIKMNAAGEEATPFFQHL